MTPTAVTASPTTLRSRAFVEAHLDQAVALGRRAGEDTQDPRAIAESLAGGLPALADPEYLDGQRRVAPGIGELAGVRNPLLAAVTRGLRTATRQDGPSTLLDIAEHLLEQVYEQPAKAQVLASRKKPKKEP